MQTNTFFKTLSAAALALNRARIEERMPKTPRFTPHRA